MVECVGGHDVPRVRVRAAPGCSSSLAIAILHVAPCGVFARALIPFIRDVVVAARRGRRIFRSTLRLLIALLVLRARLPLPRLLGLRIGGLILSTHRHLLGECLAEVTNAGSHCTGA